MTNAQMCGMNAIMPATIRLRYSRFRTSTAARIANR